MRRAAKTFRKYLIPHEENDHKPHLLRPRTVIFVCMVAIAIEAVLVFGSSYLIPRSNLFGIIAVNSLIDGTNQARLAENIPALRENPLLDAAALQKANDMVKNNYFAHTSPAGLTPWYWFNKAGYQFAAAGENLAVDFADSDVVTRAWLDSPEHRANILNAGFTEIGMAAAQGTFDGHPAIYVVELFGSPAVASVSAPVSAPAIHVAEETPKPAPEPVIAANANNTFASVKGASAEIIPPAAASAPPPAAAPAHAANIVRAAVADPVQTVDYFYLAIVLIFLGALLTDIFVKIKIQHPQPILGGMLVILLVGLCIIINEHSGIAAVTIL